MNNYIIDFDQIDSILTLLINREKVLCDKYMQFNPCDSRRQHDRDIIINAYIAFVNYIKMGL